MLEPVLRDRSNVLDPVCIFLTYQLPKSGCAGDIALREPPGRRLPGLTRQALVPLRIRHVQQRLEQCTVAEGAGST
jgi:hypothetical protein